MAYDPNDPADVAIVTAAVTAERKRLQAEHETEIEGLVNKRDELLVKLRKARTGGDDNTAGEIERIENQLTETQAELRTAQSSLREANRNLTTVTGERDAANASLATEKETSRNDFVKNALTAGLVEAKVRPEFLEDLTGSMDRQVVVKEVNGERQAFVGDKSLSDYLKEWSQGDKGKHYVGAPINGGGGSTPPGTPPSGDKKIWQMTAQERVAAHNADPAGFQARVDAGESVKPADAKN